MENMLKGKNIIVGITGSIAAYKSQLLVRELVKEGANVNVIITPSAEKFVTRLTLENLSRNPVIVEMFSESVQSGGAWHIHKSHECNLMIIAPCSATTLGKLANGICDTSLVAVATALPNEIPLLIAPAMDSTMWLNPATQKNVKFLDEIGVVIIPPEEGDLSSGFTGPGRLPELNVLMDYIKIVLSEKKARIPGYTKKPGKFDFSQNAKITDEDIENAVEKPLLSIDERIENDKWNAELELTKMKQDFSGISKVDFLKGKTILISAGPTIEKIDDVRFISNFSSGKMGFALAKIAHELGADVILVSGPVSIQTPEGIKRIDVESADEMYDSIMNEFYKCDIAIMAAAVADYTPINPYKGKLKKTVVGEKLTVELQSTNDILSTLGTDKREDQTVVGFALESIDEIENGWKKMKAKNCDMMVVNTINKPKSGFRGDENTITILKKDGTQESFPPMSKTACSLVILKRIIED
ncbi:MAG: bifunctional phosphopantothenoylcysteine decarboxylase/phosphopantothenate synthase [Ignavibacteriae bacterium]|nr:bifunctional phosphopantothenoylcysteine decarboxylase/phosphopantothenate synthase [Ignavibacteriota bacterium]